MAVRPDGACIVVAGFAVKYTGIDLLDVTEKAHVPVPEQTLPFKPHEVKVEFESGVAVNVTTVPEVTVIEQVDPQFRPPTLLVTVPLPVPGFVTVTV